MYVNYHLNLGIDSVVLFFDDPEDEGFDYFARQENIIAYQCDDAYWAPLGKRPKDIETRLRYNMTVADQILTERNFTWQINIDNDELLYPKGDLKSLLGQYEGDAVQFEMLEAVSDRVHCKHIFETRTFKRIPSPRRTRAALKLRCSKPFFEHEYFRGHMVSKMAIRLNGKVLRQGIHRPDETAPDFRIHKSKTIQMLHYDCVGIDSWKTKWNYRLDLSGAALEMRGARERQMQLYAAAKVKGEKHTVALFRRLHCLSMKDRLILHVLKLLTIVRINRAMFERAPIKQPALNAACRAPAQLAHG